jgi:predicted 3-demethylubiquinone-9 3-methyltransferase (glyoxalase superfamily)
MPKLTPFLWFDDNAEEAMNFYLSVFPNSKVVAVTRYGDGGPGPKGSVMTAAFQLDGQDFVALNGGPVFKFTEAVSLVVNCETQAEVDRYWDKLTAGGGRQGECGWLKDKFGFSWQVVPSLLTKLLADKDAAKTARVMGALMKMTKLDADALQRAYEGP